MLSILSKSRYNCNHKFVRFLKHKINSIPLQADPSQFPIVKDLEIEHNNIVKRKSNADLTLINTLMTKLYGPNGDLSTTNSAQLVKQLRDEIKKLPNATHPAVIGYGDDPVEIQSYGTKPEFPYKPKTFADLCKRLNILRTEHLGNFTGTKTYYLLNDLAQLETALVKFTVANLRRHNFKLISVPDMLPAEVIEGCGMSTSGDRNQVYKLTPTNLCLSGTAEMALAGHFAGRTINSDQTINVVSASRCYRAETSGLQEEKGIYRVHNFMKVEMFAVCAADQSDATLERFRTIEIGLFELLGLHFKLLDMPPCELGAPAYRKYDIEAWMPGRSMYGEISSCSNCTDYQAKRLDIKWTEANGQVSYAHTVNGTACAVPRMLIAIVENYQNEDGSITIPKALQKYMDGKTAIVRTKALPELKLIKSITDKF